MISINTASACEVFLTAEISFLTLIKDFPVSLKEKTVFISCKN